MIVPTPICLRNNRFTDSDHACMPSLVDESDSESNAA